MPDVSTPAKLRAYCIKHEENGGVGLLISGGSTSEGTVPLTPFLDTIRWIKENTDLLLNIHTGMLNKEEAEAVASTGVDVVSVDLVGSEDTLRQVYGLDKSIEAYDATLVNLVDGGANVAPHICVGLHYGEIKGEKKAIELAAEVRPESVVFISLIPTTGTLMENVQPPKVKTITDLISIAGKKCSESEIGLGCMRSRSYKTELEWGAIKAGAKRIALASRSTEHRALEAGYGILKLDGCCATPKKYDSLLLRA